MTDCSGENLIRCCCCGAFLEEGKEYYYLDDDGNEVKEHPLCCECAA